jgi:hypothetical protein
LIKYSFQAFDASIWSRHSFCYHAVKYRPPSAMFAWGCLRDACMSRAVAWWRAVAQWAVKMRQETHSCTPPTHPRTHRQAAPLHARTQYFYK